MTINSVCMNNRVDIQVNMNFYYISGGDDYRLEIIPTLEYL